MLRGKPSGDLVLEKIMSDEQVQPGEKVLTSGGDRIFPKGLAIGTVMKVLKSSDSFLTIRVRPGANLAKLEEVLVITQREERAPSVAQPNMRAADILALRLPSVPDKPAEDPKKPGTQPAGSTVPGENRPLTGTPVTTRPAAPPAKPVTPPKAGPGTTPPPQEKPQ